MGQTSINYKEIIEIIKTRVRISELAGSDNKRIQCPFCKSSALDMQLFHNDNSFKCFSGGCGASGSVLDWVINRDGCNIKQAVESLASRLNISLESSSKRSDILEIASQHFEKALFNNQEVIDYWESRGIHRDTLYRYRVGYCNEKILDSIWRSNISKATTNPLAKLSYEDLEGAALITGEYPAFINHTVFPYRNWSTKVIQQMQGRFVGDSTTLKPNEVRWRGLRTKSKLGDHNITTMLWGEEELRSYWSMITPNNLTYTFLNEGIPDALTLRQKGINALSLVGHQNLYQHAWKLTNFDSVFLIMDNDSYSQNELPIELFKLQLKLPRTQVIVVTLPTKGISVEGKPIKLDVNDFFKEGGELGDLSKIITDSPKAIDFLINKWGQEEHNYISLLSLIESRPFSERNEFLDNLANKNFFSKKELEACIKLLNIPISPAKNSRHS